MDCDGESDATTDGTPETSGVGLLDSKVVVDSPLSIVGTALLSLAVGSSLPLAVAPSLPFADPENVGDPVVELMVGSLDSSVVGSSESSSSGELFVGEKVGKPDVGDSVGTSVGISEVDGEVDAAFSLGASEPV